MADKRNSKKPKSPAPEKNTQKSPLSDSTEAAQPESGPAKTAATGQSEAKAKKTERPGQQAPKGAAKSPKGKTGPRKPAPEETTAKRSASPAEKAPAAKPAERKEMPPRKLASTKKEPAAQSTSSPQGEPDSARIEQKPAKEPSAKKTAAQATTQEPPPRMKPTPTEVAEKPTESPSASRSAKAEAERFLKPEVKPKPSPVFPPPEEKKAPPPPLEAVPEPTHEVYAPPIPSMFIVQVTPELAPLAKVGGLADVVMGLSRELELRGHSVEIVLPKYDCMRYDHIWGLTKAYEDLWVPWYNGAVHCSVWFGFVHGRKCFFIEPHSHDNFFNRGVVYGHRDDIYRFAFFSRAAMEFLWKAGKHPEIIHCHDWQTGLVPVFLYEIYQHLGMRHPRVCYTIHNFKHQGVIGGHILQATGLHRPEYYVHYDRLRDNHNPHALNLMKGGIVYSNFVTTVSPRHCGEAKDHGQGFGLEPTLHAHHQKYGGVVNGVDYEVWNPEVDPYLPVHYTIDTLDEKYKVKKALRDRFWLADNEKPIVAFIGRLDPQKGLKLVRHAIFHTLNSGGQFVLLGSSPDAGINQYFWELKGHLNESPDCHLEIGFHEELAHLIYAGADMIIVPSLFEPCGLTQLIAMRYGTIPIVRSVGGLADTVFDKDYSDKPLNERNGYVFYNYDNPEIEYTLSRAISCYYQFPLDFRELMKNAMRYDFSWKNPGQHYLNIYDYIRDKA